MVEQLSDKRGHIYFIQAVGSDDRYKIGMTEFGRLEARFKELNRRQSPYPLKLVYKIDVSDRFAAERLLHERFDAYRYHGEWFHFPKKLIGIHSVLKTYDAVAKQFVIQIDQPEVIHGFGYPRLQSYSDCLKYAIAIASIAFGISASALFISSQNQPVTNRQNQPMVSTPLPNEANTVEQENSKLGVIRVNRSNSDAARLRATPNGAVVDLLREGTQVTLGELSGDRQWRRVRTQNGQSGWVWSEFVE